ncbi:hypothetical protein NKI88_09135 [Mesorhizobium sp. M0317]|uniref:hypothetical protein n=1 Tax=Mesorhizobium sp. M0317 TaxID=2956935 RepID=UPI0033352BA2
MKLTIISEEHPTGLSVDWPSVPGTGDFVSFHFRGGTSSLLVERVEWECDADGNFVKANIELAYPA